jgi:multimeric flavodoxin WrbA
MITTKVVAVVGSYRKGGTTDEAVEAVLEGARENGAETVTFYLTDQHLEFCTNCRQCMLEPGLEPGKCVQKDDLEPILKEIESAQAVVLGSPVNFGNVTALFRKFMERLLGSSFWPWGQAAPRQRVKKAKRKAALVASSGMPGFLIPLLTGTRYALRTTAKMLGANPVGSLWIGLAAGEPHHPLSKRDRERARRIGRKLT